MGTNFNIQIFFGNGVCIEKSVSLPKAYKLSQKPNVIIDDEAGYYEVHGLNDSIVIPLNMVFVVSKSPDFKHTERVSRYMLYRRDGGRCAYCGKPLSQKEATIDHIVPQSEGGKTTWENCVLSCKPCNSAKDNRRLEDCGFKLRVKPYNPKRGCKK